MSIIKLGGLGFGRSRSMEDAIKKSRIGDIIEIKKNLSANEKQEPLLLNHDLTIDGNNNTISVYHDKPLLVADSELSLTIKNLKIFLQKKSNFLLLGENFKGNVSFDNVEVEFSTKSDSRDFFSPIHANTSNYSLTLNHVKTDFLKIIAESMSIQNSQIGSLTRAESLLYTNRLNIKNTSLNHMTIKSMFSDTNALLTGENLKSQGKLAFEEIDGNISYLQFIPYLNQKGEAFSSEKEYLKSFTNDIYRLDQLVYLIINQTGKGQFGKPFEISNLSFPSEQCSYFKTCPSIISESELLLTDSTLEFNPLKGVLVNSTVRFENVADLNDWTVKENVKLSNLNSQSILFNDESKESNKTAVEEIKEYIGLENVKSQLDDLISSSKMNALRLQRGLPTTSGFSMHMIFGGHAGTGKTSIAKLFGKALYESGVLPTNRFAFASEPDLVAGYVGQTAQKTKDIVMSAKGGVLFIDEAYSLTPEEGQNSFKQEAIDQIVALADELREDTVIILAGYTDPMKKFLQANEGLASRFKNWIEFPDYSLEELIQILDINLKQQGIIISEHDQEVLLESFLNVYNCLTNNGQTYLKGNGRTIRNYVQDLIQTRDVRINSQFSNMELTNDDLQQINSEDIRKVEEKYMHN
ncbi:MULTISPECIES: AAA family ATPase [Aerococcus]|nr:MULTISPECIES: AAA family ATPase [Aerococcus]MBU5610959.1 AAA family ATPase [Aerococcus urinae]MCY3034045.1 AAA family ATPase [Aerococcus mictus]MCY3065813.1 AAA family ATPase [Aerococcus mictus]MCY3066431.1 AAA family ATPase [Aerococcus mictus]MCY3071356.1 AAA family ATPase [Aerococcus mictus]